MSFLREIKNQRRGLSWTIRVNEQLHQRNGSVIMAEVRTSKGRERSELTARGNWMGKFTEHI